jgi:ribosomal protein L30/L7E
MQTTQKHIDIIESLRLRAIKDKSLLNGSLTNDENK